MPDTLYIVIPCYNEQEALPETSRRIKIKLDDLKTSKFVSPESRILFVNDGSVDNTWDIVKSLHQADPGTFSGVNLTSNRGHQNALMAELMTAKDRADAVISMDADLQDDIDALDAFWEKYTEGHDVVYGVRNDRTADTSFKRTTAQGYYKVLAQIGRAHV